MNLSPKLKQSCVDLKMGAEGVSEVVAHLVHLLALEGVVGDEDSVVRKVIDREEIMTTGVGNGVAVPHASDGSVAHVSLSVGRIPKPIDFDSIDGKPVDLVILIVSPEESVEDHLKALARLSQMLRDESFLQRLRSTDDPAEFVELFREKEREVQTDRQVTGSDSGAGARDGE